MVIVVVRTRRSFFSAADLFLFCSAIKSNGKSRAEFKNAMNLGPWTALLAEAG